MDCSLENLPEGLHDNRDGVEQGLMEAGVDDTDQVAASVGAIETIDNALDTVAVSEWSNVAGMWNCDGLALEFA